MANQMKYCRLDLEGLENVEIFGFYQPDQHWNGFLIPFVSAETIELINPLMEPENKFELNSLDNFEIDGKKYYEVSCGLCWMQFQAH